MKSSEFIKKLELALSQNSAYMWGTWGNKITTKLISKKKDQYSTRYSDSRVALLTDKVGKNYWGWDCCGLIKGILWGWNGDTSKSNGGAVYGANNVPDTTASGLKKYSTEISTDFSDVSKILPGELLWKPGHVGVYIGDGYVIESTLRGSLDGVVKTKLSDYDWAEHGKIKFIEYEKPVEPEKPVNNLPWKVGDIVFFCGGNVYASSMAPYGSASQAKAGPAKITAIAPDAAHVYHIVHTDKTSNVYGWVDEPYVGIYTPPTPTPEPTPEPIPEPTPAPAEFKIGDVVQYKGGLHYSSSTAAYGASALAGPAKITAIVKGTKHPYHLIHTDKQSNVYGWVNEADIEKIVAPTPVSPAPTPIAPTPTPTPVSTEIKVGDVVEFTGGKNYICSSGLIGYKRKAGPAKVTRISEGKKYPYHVVRISGKGSNVYGWVAKNQIQK